jgi:hypothetical protein
MLDARLKVNPAHGVKLPTERSSEGNKPGIIDDPKQFLAAVHVSALVDATPWWYTVLVHVAAFAGLRAGELDGLQVGNVEPPELAINPNREGSRPTASDRLGRPQRGRGRGTAGPRLETAAPPRHVLQGRVPTGGVAGQQAYPDRRTATRVEVPRATPYLREFVSRRGLSPPSSAIGWTTPTYGRRWMCTCICSRRRRDRGHGHARRVGNPADTDVRRKCCAAARLAGYVSGAH